MINWIKKYWFILITVGYILAHLSQHLGIDNIEIHYRLLLIFIFTAISLGGYLLLLFPWKISVALLAIINVFVFYKYVINRSGKG